MVIVIVQVKRRLIIYFILSRPIQCVKNKNMLLLKVQESKIKKMRVLGGYFLNAFNSTQLNIFHYFKKTFLNIIIIN